VVLFNSTSKFENLDYGSQSELCKMKSNQNA